MRRKKTKEEVEADRYRLYEIIYRHNMTLPELADELGMTYGGLQGTLSKGISVKTAARIGALLNEPLENFFAKEEMVFYFKCPSCGETHSITIK